MTKRKRTNHSPNVKASAALEALTGEKTLVELSEKYGVHANLIQRWKKELKDHAIDVFGGNDKDRQDQEKTIQQLHEKVGQLTMERDFLSKALGK